MINNDVSLIMSQNCFSCHIVERCDNLIFQQGLFLYILHLMDMQTHLLSQCRKMREMQRYF